MKNKINFKNSLSMIVNIGAILLGNTVLAFAVAAFVIPNNLISGGSTGLALLVNHAFGIDITLFVSIFNPAMFILGLILLGKKFAVTTLISSFYYPLILGIFRSLPSLSDDKLL